MTAQGTELVWGVKGSLIRYVHRLADGRVDASCGAEFGADGCFHLPFRRQEGLDDGRTIAFDGEIHIEGHGGLLSISLADLQVEITIGRTLLTASIIDLDSGKAVQRPIATLAAKDARNDDAREVWDSVEARLTPAGAEVLGQLQYYATQRVDDVTYSAPALPAHHLGAHPAA